MTAVFDRDDYESVADEADVIDVWGAPEHNLGVRLPRLAAVVDASGGVVAVLLRPSGTTWDGAL